MPRGLPPLTWFRAFEAAARHLNFTSAADELGLTQSAISQHVRSLEMRLGVQLFRRNPRGLSLTDDGRRLAPQVGSAIAMLASAAASYDAGPSERLLTVATSVSIAQWILAPHLSSFAEEHPNVRLRILSTIWPDDFKASVADVEIRFGSEKQVGAGARRMTPDSLIVIGSPKLQGPLEDLPLIEAVGTSEGWRHWAEHVGCQSRLEPSLLVDAHGLALDLAVNGAGVALTSSLLAANAVAAGRVERKHSRSLDSSDGYFLAVNATTDAARAFEDWFQRRVTHATVATSLG